MKNVVAITLAVTITTFLEAATDSREDEYSYVACYAIMDFGLSEGRGTSTYYPPVTLRTTKAYNSADSLNDIEELWHLHLAEHHKLLDRRHVLQCFSGSTPVKARVAMVRASRAAEAIFGADFAEFESHGFESRGREYGNRRCEHDWL